MKAFVKKHKTFTAFSIMSVSILTLLCFYYKLKQSQRQSKLKKIIDDINTLCKEKNPFLKEAMEKNCLKMDINRTLGLFVYLKTPLELVLTYEGNDQIQKWSEVKEATLPTGDKIWALLQEEKGNKLKYLLHPNVDIGQIIRFSQFQQNNKFYTATLDHLYLRFATNPEILAQIEQKFPNETCIYMNAQGEEISKKAFDNIQPEKSDKKQ